MKKKLQQTLWINNIMNTIYNIKILFEIFKKKKTLFKSKPSYDEIPLLIYGK